MSADWISVQSGSDANMVEDNQILQYDFDNLNISFNGCGFLGVYHVGVASALHHYLPNMEFNYVCGASAGAMAGSCLVGKIPLGMYMLGIQVQNSKKKYFDMEALSIGCRNKH